MTQLERQVGKARFRLTMNHWFGLLCFAVTVAAGAFAAIVLLDRMYGWDWPLGVLCLGLVSAAFIISIIWATATRVEHGHAAAILDEAAGLRERLSSGLHCVDGTDPFERAVLASAEETSANLAVSRHIRYTMPSQLGGASIAVVLAAAMLLLPSGMLASASNENDDNSVQVKRAAIVVNKRTERIKRRARTNTALRKLAEDLDQLPDGEFDKPADVRHSALKKLDRMRDILKQQRGSEKFEHAKEFKKMLRGLKPSNRLDTPANRLAKALAKGDFKAARALAEEMRKQLASVNPKDVHKLQAMQKQLEQLAKKLEALANDDKAIKQLQQAGLKKEDIERMLKNLTAEDIQKIKERLEKQGLSQEAIQKLTKALQKRMGANKMAQKLAEALNQAAQALAAGSPSDAASGMEGAGGQLSDLEMLEQEMNEIDSMMADLQSAKNDLGNPCSTCNGTGMVGGGRCGSCGGRGNGGMGNMGRGRGGIAAEEQGSASFVKRRDKVHAGKGAIIGSILVDGKQVKGSVTSDIGEVLAAGERDATDAIDRARIPRRYHDAIKGYFSDVQKEMGKRHGGGNEKKDSTATDR